MVNFLARMKQRRGDTTPSGEQELARGSRGRMSRRPPGSWARLVLMLWLSLVMALAGTARAQTIAITPYYPTVILGSSVQFTATVTGLSNTAVTWLVAGVVGGNAALGTITADGLYTAPATMPTRAYVTAMSKAVPTLRFTTYITLQYLGPTITSVAPSPLYIGAFSVTVGGSGFKTGARVMMTSSNGASTWLTTTSVTPTSITATGSQTQAGSVSFSVKNTDSVPGNSLTVPFSAGFPLSVTNGSGSGTYVPGKVVTIKASAAPTGKTFLNWTGATVANANLSSTTLTMPAAATAVTANYVDQHYTLTVVNGTGGGSYTAATVVPIQAAAPPSGQIFQSWTGTKVNNATAPSTTLTMPAANTQVTATYVNNKYALTVVGGTGSGSYAAGTTVSIKAAAAPSGKMFQSWTGATVASPTSPATTLIMPTANTTVTASYVDIPTYILNVIYGTGSGRYPAGATVVVQADAPPYGQSFLYWRGWLVGSETSPATTLVMPAADTTVTANYGTKSNQPVSCANMSLGQNASLNGFVPFPADNLWNTDISNAPVDPNNDVIISAAGFVNNHLHHDFSSVSYANYGIPYVVVDSATTPFVSIGVTEFASESDVSKAPFPTSTPIEGSPADCAGWPSTYLGDAHTIVLDRNSCMLYETFNTHRCNSAWSASSQAIWDMQNYSDRPYGWTSADAAGLPIFPGLIRYDEIESGAINHAIRFTMKQTKDNANGGYFVAPATHAAGVYWGVKNVMGMRIRLKASFDISKYSWANQVILTTMKRYGMILADNGGNFYFQGVPDPRWVDTDLLNLDAIASSNFEVVQTTPAYPGYDAATAPEGTSPVINSFNASDATVAAGTPVTLTWSTAYDSYDFIDQLGGVRGNSVTVTPTATTTYTLNATNHYGRATAQVTVTVQ